MDKDTLRRLERGREHYENREYDRAEPYLVKVAQVEEGFADVMNMLGVIYHDRGQVAMAQEYFEKALRINPRYTEAALNLAVTYNEQGMYDKAKRIHEHATSLAPQEEREIEPFARGKLSNMHADLGRAFALQVDLTEVVRDLVDKLPQAAGVRFAALYLLRGDRLERAAGPAELILRAAERRIAVVAAHTNLDSAAGGLNELMAAAIGVFGTVPITPHPDWPDLGLGRIGKRPQIRLGDLLAKIREIYGQGEVTLTGDPATVVQTVACCTGSGAGLIDAARELGADVYVTCDLKYHDADRAGQMPLIGLGHATVESRAMRRWSEKLAAQLQTAGAEVLFAQTDTDPWSPPR